MICLLNYFRKYLHEPPIKFPSPFHLSNSFLNPSTKYPFVSITVGTLNIKQNFCVNEVIGAEFPYLLMMNKGKYGSKKIGSYLFGKCPESSEKLPHMNVGKPPVHFSANQNCASAVRLVDSSKPDLDMRPSGLPPSSDEHAGFKPIFRSGCYTNIGPKPFMEDEHVCIDDMLNHVGASIDFLVPSAFYGVFDGHGGVDAASFVRKNLLKFIIEDYNFPTSMEKAMKSAFRRTDHAFADSPYVDCSSGTTVLATLIFGRTMLIANDGDCRAVLGKRGRAIELSRDHKPNSISERLRIEELGGIICDGYLDGQISVSRALGDWHMKGQKGNSCPLSAEPEFQETILTEEDEFLIMACDGLWDVMSSEYAVSTVRRELMTHNDPERCSRELVLEALRRNTCDNLTVIVICFSLNPPPRIERAKSRVRKSISMEGLQLLKGVLDSNA